MNLNSGDSFVSNIAINHIETLYRSDKPSLAAIVDLAAVCEAAIFSEQLVVSPKAFKNSSLLQSLNCVYSPDITVSYELEEPLEPVESNPAKDDQSIPMDIDDTNRLFSDHSSGELFLAILAIDDLCKNKILGPLANPDALAKSGTSSDFIEQLPKVMLLLQARKGVLKFESEDSREYFSKKFDPTYKLYDDYAERLCGLEEKFSIQPVWSCLEAPLAENERARHAVDTVRSESFWEEYKDKYRNAAIGPRGAYQYFEKWSAPPLGLMVLSEAKGLEDIPVVIDRFRDMFGKTRQHLMDLQREKDSAKNGVSSYDDRNWKKAHAIDQEIKAAFAAFDEKLESQRLSKKLRGVRWVLNIPKFMEMLVSSLGLGTISSLLSLTNAERNIYLCSVPNFWQSLTLLKRFDEQPIIEIMEKFLHMPTDKLGTQPEILRLAGLHSQHYLGFEDGNATACKDGSFEFIIDDAGKSSTIPLSDSEMWSSLALNDEFRRVFLCPYL